MDCIDHCGMVDLGFSGSRYTWINCRQLGGLIRERLDRCLANVAWTLAFPEVSVKHLVRTHSDHCPVLLNSDPSPSLSVDRPFRFEPMWFFDPSFIPLVEHCWDNSNTFSSLASNFVDKVRVWNKDHFGNIFHKKKILKARILGTQKALNSKPCQFLLDLEANLTKDFNDLLKLEEDFWAVKSRTNWLLDGDRNTNFFHLSTINRRRSNRILSLKDSTGKWISDINELHLLTRTHFSNLFTTEWDFDLLHPPSIHVPQIPTSKHDRLLHDS